MSSKELGSRLRRSARIAAARGLPVKSTNDVRHLPKRRLPAARINKTVKTVKTIKSENPITVRAPKCNIYSLNDDCILKIFTYLSPIDLFSISDIDDRLSYLAYLTIKKMFRDEDYIRLPSRPKNQNNQVAVLMLRKFGKFITHLYIEDMMPFITLCNRTIGTNFVSMMNNCTALKCVRFEKIYHPNDVSGFEKIFENVETIELKTSRSHAINLGPILKNSKKLKHITLENIVVHLQTLMSITRHVNLESICFRNSYFDYEFLIQLRWLRNLKKLELANVYHKITIPDIHALARITWLEELNLECILTDDHTFMALCNLNSVPSGTLYMHSERKLSAEAMASVNNFVINEIKHVTLYTSYKYAYTYCLVPRPLT